MSLLYPLYALAALGVAAPILFHLFQRKPQGQREFSSLLFLTPTPPKVTNRSRISDLLLLLCRALILLLLAIAFARPFVRSASLMDVEAPSRSVVLLVDTSASMRRDGVWEETQAKIKNVIDDLRAVDEVSLVSFDRQPAVTMSFEAWQEFSEGERIDWVRQQAEALEPTWEKTDLATALTYASDLLLQQQADEQDSQTSRPLQIVLFSDLQEGSDLVGLQSYRWPSEIDVDLRSAIPENRSNASVQWLPADSAEQDVQRIRVLVRNESESNEAQLELNWQDEATPTFTTHVPPGQTRVVRLKQPANAYELTLTGDQQSFDNTAYFPLSKPDEEELWHIGPDVENRESLLFYLLKSPMDTRQRNVKVQTVSQPTALATVSPDKVPLVIVEEPFSNSAENLKRYVSTGGRLLLVLTSDKEKQTAMEPFIGELLDLQGISISEVETNESDYAMLSEVDFANPLLQPFADPRFSDFTKIRFWKHRSLTSSSEDPWKVVARFDDDTPALVEKQIEQGTVWIMASGWQPEESQLALSTKFVPLLHGFYGELTESVSDFVRYEVGDAIPIRESDEPTMVLTPSEESIAIEKGVTAFTDTNNPGIYEIQQGGQSYKVAVNLAKEESRTSTLLPGRLEQLGVSLGEKRTVVATEMEQRQMRNKELEGRQKFWRWGVLGALCFVVGETLLTRRSGAGALPETAPAAA